MASSSSGRVNVALRSVETTPRPNRLPHMKLYLGFGVVGLVVVFEQQAPQQFPHAQAITHLQLCCADPTPRTAGGCVASVGATARALPRWRAHRVRSERLLPLGRAQRGGHGAATAVRGEPRAVAADGAPGADLRAAPVREPRSRSRRLGRARRTHRPRALRAWPRAHNPERRAPPRWTHRVLQALSQRAPARTLRG